MGTVEADEMAFFEKVSRVWWEPNGPLKQLHSLNELMVPLMAKSVAESGICLPNYINSPTPLRGLSILDVGCGAGLTSEALAKLGCEVTGLDPCEEMIKVATEHAALNRDLTNLKYVSSDVETFAEQNEEKFDVIVSCGVLEHVTKYEEYLEACVKCLKRGGSIFVITFNRTYLAWFGAVFLAEYVLNLAPRGIHQWKKFVALAETKRVLKKRNCGKKSVVQVMFNLFAGAWYLTRFKGIVYGIHSIKE